MKRRDFLIAAAGLGVVGAVGVGFGGSLFRKTRYLLTAHYSPTATKIGVSILDLAKSEAKFVRTDFLIHSFLKHPINPNLVIGIPKHGAQAYAIDVNTLECTEIMSRDGKWFYGHGCFSADGKTFFAAESLAVKSQQEIAYLPEGEIGVYAFDERTLAVNFDRAISSHGSDPHDIMMIDPTTIAIANGGTNSNVSFIDVPSFKLKSQLANTVERQSFRHFLTADPNESWILTQTIGNDIRPQIISVTAQGAESFKTDTISGGEKSFNSQILSGAQIGDTLVTTCPLGHAVHVWDAKTKSLLESIDYKSATGVVADETRGEFIVNSGEGEKLLYIDAASRTHRFVPLSYQLLVSGSHSLLLFA